MGFWTVSLTVTLRGTGQTAKVEAYLPNFTQDQAILDEKSASGGLRLFIRESGPEKENRLAVWSGRVQDTVRLSHTATVALDDETYILPKIITRERSAESLEPWLRPSGTVPADARRIRDAARELTGPADDPVTQVKKLFRFVSVEVETSGSLQDSDALLTLQRKRGNAHGKAHLFASLLRAAGIPARVAGGILLKEGTTDKFHFWNEVYLNGWIPADVTRDLLGRATPDMLVLRRGGVPRVTAGGVRAFSYEYRVVRELQTVVEQTRALSAAGESWVNRYSPFALPLDLQLVFRVLLLIPMGCLIVAVLRNMVGINTFGTFMPVLVALAFLQTTLVWGLLFLAVIIGLGVGARKVLDKMYLLRVPRLGVIVTFVILVLLALTIVGGTRGIQRAVAVGFFPIIVMTMMIERLVVTLAEEGTRNALVISGYTAVAASVCYLALSSEFLQDLFFLFPEFLLAVMALLLLIGRYTGYRLTEYFRFKAFLSSP